MLFDHLGAMELRFAAAWGMGSLICAEAGAFRAREPMNAATGFRRIYLAGNDTSIDPCRLARVEFGGSVEECLQGCICGLWPGVWET